MADYRAHSIIGKTVKIQAMSHRLTTWSSTEGIEYLRKVCRLSISKRERGGTMSEGAKNASL